MLWKRKEKRRSYIPATPLEIALMVKKSPEKCTRSAATGVYRILKHEGYNNSEIEEILVGALDYLRHQEEVRLAWEGKR